MRRAAAFDNISGTSSPLGNVLAIQPAVAAPVALLSAPGTFVRVDDRRSIQSRTNGSRPCERTFAETSVSGGS